MPWYKGWLETRFRLLLTFAAIAFFLISLHSLHPLPTPNAKAAVMATLGVPKISMLWICAFLAGSGIATQPAIQATKGLHGSTLFTLSLPVSRLRLIATRATIGWLETVLAVIVFCYGIWLLIPVVNTTVTGTDMIGFTATLIAAITTLYSVSVLLATFLDDVWRIYGTMLIPVALWQFSIHVPLPAFADILRGIGNGSPLITHTMPWTTVVFSLALAAVFLFTAVKVAEAREY